MTAIVDISTHPEAAKAIEYIRSLPPGSREALESVKQLIRNHRAVGAGVAVQTEKPQMPKD